MGGLRRGGVVLGGGMSRRMGRNKAFLLFGGRVMVRCITDALSRVSDEVVVVISQRHDLSQYRQVLPESVRIIRDISPQQSPVVGILSGLSALNSQYTCVASCDLPLIKPEVLKFLFEEAEGFDAAIPRWPDGEIEPLHAVYDVQKTRGAAEEAFAAYEWKNTDIIKRLPQVRYISIEDIRRIDPELKTFFNVNTPDEYEKALAIVQTTGP